MLSIFGTILRIEILQEWRKSWTKSKQFWLAICNLILMAMKTAKLLLILWEHTISSCVHAGPISKNNIWRHSSSMRNQWAAMFIILCCISWLWSNWRSFVTCIRLMLRVWTSLSSYSRTNRGVSGSTYFWWMWAILIWGRTILRVGRRNVDQSLRISSTTW